MSVSSLIHSEITFNLKENTTFSQYAYDISGAESGGLAGQSISKNLAGDIIAVGAPLNSGGGTARGEVRVYQKDNNSWMQLGNDLNGTTDNEEFGYSVDLNGDGTILAVGTKDNSHKTLIYKYATGTTTTTTTANLQLGGDIYGEVEGDQMGRYPNSVSINDDGTIIALGSWINDDNGNNSGHARVYQYSNSAWTQLGANIAGEDAENYFGRSLSLSSDGTIVAIGGSGNNSATGHVRVYQYDGSSWNQLGADIDGEAASDHSGFNVSLSSDGTIVAIGAPYNDGTGNNSGHVRVYQYSNSAWTQLGTDIDGEVGSDSLGISVSLSSDGTIIAIGASGNDGNGDMAGHVRVYQYSNSAWTQLGSDIDGEAADDNSGYSVSLSSDGTIIAIGAYNNVDDNGNNTGHVRVFKYNGSDWTQLGSDIDGEAAGDWSGYSVSLSSDGTIVAIGAYLNDGVNGADSGHVRVYQYSNSAWTQIGADYDGPVAEDRFGQSVALNSSGNIMVVGAPWHDQNGDKSGLARVYETGVTSSGSWSLYGNIIDNQVSYELPTVTTTTTTTANQQLGDNITKQANGDGTGYSCAINGDGTIVAVGAVSSADNGTNSGEVRVYIRDVNNTTTAPVGWSSLGSDIMGEADSDYFGTYCELNDDGSIIAISSSNNNDNGSDAGHVRVWQYSTPGVIGGYWTQIGQDIDGEAASDYSGTSVSLSSDGSIVAIGSYYNDGSTGTTSDNRGHVRIWKYNGVDTWTQLGSDIEGATQDFTTNKNGLSLNSDGDIVAIGYMGNDDAANLAGCVKIFKYTTPGVTGGIWEQLGSINGSAEDERFGYAVSLTSDGSIVAIGNSNVSSSINGLVRIYQYSNSDMTTGGSWNQIGDDIASTQSQDYFGSVLSINSTGSIVAIGAMWYTNTLSRQGMVRIYERDESASIGWSQLGSDHYGLYQTKYLGYMVRLNSAGSIVIFSANTDGHAEVFETGAPGTLTNSATILSASTKPKLNKTGDKLTILNEYNFSNLSGNGQVQTYEYSASDVSWNYLGDKIESASVNDISGGDIAINDEGNMIAIGYPQINSATGTTKVFKYDTSWNQIGSNIDGSATGDHAGTSVVIDGSGDFVAIGSPFAGDASAGEVNVYQNVSDTWTLYGNKIQGQSDNDQFGTSIDMTPAGNILAVGAPNANAGKGNINIYQSNTTDSSWNQLGGDLSGDAVGDLTGTSVKLNQLGTEVSVGEPNTGPLTLGRVRTFDIGHTKIYDANTFQSSYLDGFLDISGGVLRTRNADDHLLIGGDASMSGNVFVKGNETIENKNVILRTTLTDISFTQLENTNFTQYAYDISGAESGGLAGHSISTSASGDIIAVGAPLNSGGGTARGEVRVYQKDNNSWLQLGNDLNGAADNDEFGHSVDLNDDGTILAVGTKDVSHKTYLYKYDSGSWSLYGNTIENNVSYQNIITETISNTFGQLGNDIDGNGTTEYFGRSVSLNSDGTVVAVASSNYNSSTGYVRICKYDGSSWFQLGSEIIGEAGGDQSGYDVSINSDGSIVAIGAFTNDSNAYNAGHVRVWQYSNSDMTAGGSWTKIGNDILGKKSGDYFGRSVSISNDGSVLAIGAYRNDDNGNNSGHTRVYLYSNSDWIQIGEDIIGEDAGDNSGYAVELNGDGSVVVIGSIYSTNVNGDTNAGQVRVWKYSNPGVTGGSWTQLGDDIEGEAYNDWSGYAVSINSDGSIIALSDRSNDDNGDDAGRVRVFQYSNSDMTAGGSWIQIGNNILGEGAGDYLTTMGGLALSSDGTVLACGSQNNNSNTGHTRIYQYINSEWIQVGDDIEGENSNDRFGYSVSLSSDGSIVAIGALYYSEIANYAGQVRIFTTAITFTNTTTLTTLSASTKPKLNKEGDKLTIISEQHFDNLSGNGQAQSYQYSESDASWNYLGDKIESASINDISGGDIAINDEGNMIAIGYPQNNSATGTTKVYKYDTSWNQIGSNIDGSATGDHAGTAVVMDGSGDFVAIGSPFAGDASAGEVNVYQNVSDTWTLYGNKIQGQADNDQFGTSVDIDSSGTILAVGAVNANAGAGNVNIYEYNTTDSSWNKVGGDLTGDAVGDLTGTSVKLNQLGTEVSVGEPGSNSTFYYTPWTYASQTQIDWNFLFDGSTSVTSSISGHVGTYVVGSNVTAANETYHGKSTASGGFASTKSSSNNLEDGAGITGIDIPHGNVTKFTYEFYFDFGTKTYADNDGCILITTTETATTLNGWVEISINGENFECKYYDDSDDSGTYHSFTAENPAGSTGTGKQHIVIATHFMANAAAFEAHVNGVAGAQGNNWSSGEGPGTHDTRWLNLLGCHDRTLPNTGNGWQANLLFFRLHKYDWNDQWYEELYNIREPISERYGGSRTFEIEHTKIYEHEYNTQSNSALIGHNEYSRNQFATALDVSGNVDVSGNIVVTGNVTIPGNITVDGLNYNSINKVPPVSIDYSDITEDLSFNHKIEIMTNDNSLQTSSLTIHNDLSNNGTFGSSFVYDNSLSVTGSVVVVDASNTNYGSYTVYSKADGSDSFVVGKSASHVFNIVNQSNVGVWMQLDGNSFVSTSDKNLKKDIEDLGEETDSIMKLRPVKFNWNYEEEDKEKHIGFIAQEVEELFPDLVEENTYPDGSTYKGVDKTKLIPHLVNEIKSIKKEIEELKK